MNTEQDQAQKLRELVREVGGQRSPKRCSPAVVAIVGCCPGVGATCVTSRLGVALDADSFRVEIRSNDALLDDAHIGGDIVLVDGGAGCSQESASRWNRTDLVLLVVTNAREALLETYGALKMAKLVSPELPIYLLPNRCRDASEAQMIHGRISDSCERFLGFAVPAAPWLPRLNAEEEQSKFDPRTLELSHFVRELTLADAARKTSAA